MSDDFAEKVALLERLDMRRGVAERVRDERVTMYEALSSPSWDRREGRIRRAAVRAIRWMRQNGAKQPDIERIWSYHRRGSPFRKRKKAAK